MLTAAERVGGELKVLRAVHEANEVQKAVLFGKMVDFYKDRGGLAGKVVSLWGLAFKPNTDDMREAPSLELIRLLLSAGASIRAYDPAASEQAQRSFGGEAGVTICRSAAEATEGASCLAIVTEWKEFRSPDFALLADRLATASSSMAATSTSQARSTISIRRSVTCRSAAGLSRKLRRV